MRRCFPIAAALVFLGRAHAQQQPGSIRGVVTDREFSAPVAEAQVTVLEAGGRRATTDRDGVFVFQQVPPGRYTLIVAKDGYLREVRPDVVVTAGQLTDAAVALRGDFTDLEPFVVADLLRPQVEGEAALLDLRLDSPALMNTIDSDLMSKAGAGDAAQALKLVSGASLQNGRSAVIRGLPDRYVSSQVNGVRMPSADEDKRAVDLDLYPSEVVSSIQVSKTFTPDQFGDASGGAVDVRLRGVPEAPFLLKWKLQTSHNTQVTGRNRFLTYDGGGLHFSGDPATPRGEQELGTNWSGAVGVSEADAPIDYKWSGAIGGRVEIAKGVRFGGTLTGFYDRDSAFDDGAVDDSYYGSNVRGAPLVPETSGTVGNFTTSLLDIVQGRQSVQWGGLGTIGIESDDHAVSLIYVFTRSADDTATLAEDTRGKEYFFPGHDPDVGTTPGHADPFSAPYLRYQTLDYTERLTSSLQLSGQHRFAVLPTKKKAPIEIDWTVAKSSADRNQPDKRLFATRWIDGVHYPLTPSATFTLGNLQRTFKFIAEDSEQITVGVKIPFTQWSGDKGYLRFGYLRDEVKRGYDQNTFSNFNIAGQPPQVPDFTGDYEQDWSDVWLFEDHPITASATDVDYRGRQVVEGTYVMADLPLTRRLNLVGGVRWETTDLSVVLEPESGATWLPEGVFQEVFLQPGDADVDRSDYDVLPSAGLMYRPVDAATVRVSYNETIARQTFKELTPILNQEYFGGPVFIGNPNLEISNIRNYDLRADVTPFDGTFLSASWFRKDIENPIEYVSRALTYTYTTAVNYPRGRLTGIELEARQELGSITHALDGLGVGGNITWIDGTVNLSADEIERFQQVWGELPRTQRDLVAAPDYLYNLFLTWNVALTRTQLGVFYTVQGDTLMAGSAVLPLVPATYLEKYDTLNVTLAQRLGDHVTLTFAAKNLTDSEQVEVFRSDYVAGDVLRRRSSDGVEYSLTLGGEIRF